jgi:SAM-dependent methyltransferase
MEQIFESGEHPVPQVRELLVATAHSLSNIQSGRLLDLGAECAGPPLDGKDVAEITGSHYGRLFPGFSDTAFFDETLTLLRLRLERNGIAVGGFRGRSLIDVGCGGGRYTCAWRGLGASPVTGVDISPLNVQDARRRSEASGLTEVRFEVANVLNLPFETESFDAVFSNGVLHHTTDWNKGITEIVRILKPEGFGWLYVIEDPGGLFWDLIEILRAVMHQESREVAHATLRTLGIPGNRVFYMLDHVMAPINIRLSPNQVANALREAGATSIRRLERGTDFDRVERIYQREPFAETKYGVGENRYVFSKHYVQ